MLAILRPCLAMFRPFCRGLGHVWLDLAHLFFFINLIARVFIIQLILQIIIETEIENF